MATSWLGAEANPSPRTLRTRRLRWAVMTSVVSKVATIGFQLVAIPVAVRALGPGQYGAFLVVSSVLAWISLGGLGVAPGVTSYVARAIGRDSVTEARDVITTGLVLALAGAGLTAVIAATVVAIVAGSGPMVEQYLDPSFVPYLPEMAAAMVVVAATALIQFPTAVMQAARAGALEQHISNAWRTVGTAVGVVGMFVVAAWAPTMVGFALALAAPAVVAGIADSIGFLLRHPEIAPRSTAVRRSLVRPLVTTGIGFLTFSVGGFLITGLSMVVASASVPADAIAPVGILFQLQGLGVGLITMFAIPLWPSVAHAYAASDREWVVTAYRRLRLAAVGVGVLGAFGIVAILPALARHLFGNAISFDPPLTLPFAALFLLASWGMVHTFVLFGLGSAAAVGALTVAQGIVGLAILAATSARLGAAAVGISALVSALVVTSWSLPMIVHRRLRAVDSPPS